MESNINNITKYIFIEPKLEQADLIFVFGTHSPFVADRVAELYHRGYAKKILVSGGENRITRENEASVISERLIKLGVECEDQILEDGSTNSLENVLFSKKVISEKLGWYNIKKILVVTKHYHIRRAMMTLRKHFPKSVQFLPAPYNILGFNKSNWHDTDSGQEKVMGEWRKIKEYLAKGDIEELD